jgi:peptide deformylase
MLLKIVIAPDPVLEKIAEPVVSINDKLVRTMYNMLETMYEANGIGLAAPQVGISKRFFVMHIDEENEDPYFFINPVIIKKSSKDSEHEEGCLSFPQQIILIHRPASITVEYLDLKGQKKRQNFDGLHATCIQHEIDHLNGVTIIDHIDLIEEKLIAKQRTSQIKKTIQ